MGYTTDFKGRFDCYRAENATIGAFLAAAYEGDAAAVGGLADWLIEHGDSRGEQLSSWQAEACAGAASFWGLFGLQPEHFAFLMRFRETRRMKRDPVKALRLPDPVREAAALPVGKEGAYFVGGRGFHGQAHDESVLDHNMPPAGQPGLWCQWEPTEDGAGIAWSVAEKFYSYVEWLEYLIEHFLGPWGYVLNGRVGWQGEIDEDRGVIIVERNEVLAVAAQDRRD